MEPSFLRASGWISPDDLANITLNIIGVGATGSNLAVTAAKMGFTKFKIWDADTVEAHNLPNQAYNISHIGLPKVESLKQVLLDFNPNINIEINSRFFTHAEDGDSLEGVVVITVDTMSARKDITNSITLNENVIFVLETRLGFDYGEINTINHMSLSALKEWRNTLKDDSEVEAGPCNLQICATLVSVIAGGATHAICSYFVAAKNNETFNYNRNRVFLNPYIRSLT